MSIKRKATSQAAQDFAARQYDLFSALNGEDDLEALEVMDRTDNVYDQMSHVVSSVAARNPHIARLSAGNTDDITNAMYLRAGGLDLDQVHDFVRSVCDNPDAVMAVVAVADTTPAAQKAYHAATLSLGEGFAREPAREAATLTPQAERPIEPAKLDGRSKAARALKAKGPGSGIEGISEGSDSGLGAGLDDDLDADLDVALGAGDNLDNLGDLEDEPGLGTLASAAGEAEVGTEFDTEVDAGVAMDASAQDEQEEVEREEVAELTGSTADILGAEEDEEKPAKVSARDSISGTQRLLNSMRSARYEPLSMEATEALAHRVQAGDEKAKQELVEHNVRFLARVAARYARSGFSMDDLFQVGSMGLIRAAELFDPTKGYRFTTYASYWIRQTIGRYLSADCLIRTPQHVNDRVVAAKKRGREALAAGDRDLAEKMEAQAAKLGRNRTSSSTFVPLDAPIGGDGEESRSLQELLESEEMGMEQATEAKKLVTWLLRATNGTTDERDGEIIQMRLGLHPDFEGEALTLAEVAQVLNISRERVRQCFERGFEEVKENVIRWAKGEENLPENFFPMVRSVVGRG